MKFAAHLTGGAQLERALRGLGSEVAGKLGVNATRAGARVIANAAKANVPIGPTRELRDSIRTFDDLQEKRAGGSFRTVYIGSRLFYSYWVEFGTVHTPARSFLRRAADEAGTQAVDKLAQNLGQGIEREAGRLR